MPARTSAPCCAPSADKRQARSRRPTSQPTTTCACWRTCSGAGVAAWAQAAPGRAQKLKGYWREKANQVAALRRFAAEHPHTPITQATLNAAGLHALAVALPSGLLEARVREAGLQRNLARRPNGHWTKAAVIARYAALCEQAGTALTNHMLAQAGGDGYTIRVQVGMLFGDFHAFRQAVALVHPHLAPDARPVTADGVLLDSFQEVVVYEALRRALPAGTSIVPHVLLADGTAQRSADFLVAGTVFVEVLMIALCEIAEPRSRTQRAYAAKWQAKAEWYAVASRPLVIVEPEDVAQPNRLARKVDEVLDRLGLSSPAEIRPAASAGKTTRPKGFWTFKALCEVVATVARQVGGFPTHADLTAAGYGNAALMLRRGMRRRVAETIGVPLRNAKGVWNLDRVQRELAAWVDAHGHFPSITELKATGHGNLASAWSRACNGRTETLRPAVERICGRRLPRRRVPNGSYATQEGLASILQPLCAELGRFPNRAEVTAAGLSPAVWAMVSTRHGVRAMAAFMGVPYAGPRRREG